MTENNPILADVTRLHLKWKPGICRRVAVAILASMLTEGATWPDEIPLGFVSGSDSSVIGTTWRRLAKAGLVQHTGEYRPSKGRRSHGRIVFQSALVSRRAAEIFINLCLDEPEPPAHRVQSDLEL